MKDRTSSKDVKIVVTGAAGFIGSHTVDELLAQGHSVVGLDNLRTGHRSNLEAAQRSKRFQFIECDVTESSLPEVFATATPDVVVHLAALVSVQESIANPDLNYLLNVHATHLVSQAALRAGVKRLVFASSAAVYGHAVVFPIRENAPTHPLSPYGWAKLASESLMLGSGQQAGGIASCLRFFNVYGPRQDPASPYSGVISIFTSRIQADLPIQIHGDGKQTRDFVHVHDVARAITLAATSKGLTSGVHNVCTGQPASLLQIVTLLERALGKVARVEHTPKREGDIDDSVGDPFNSTNSLGFTATIPLEYGLPTLLSPNGTLHP